MEILNGVKRRKAMQKCLITLIWQQHVRKRKRRNKPAGPILFKKPNLVYTQLCVDLNSIWVPISIPPNNYKFICIRERSLGLKLLIKNQKFLIATLSSSVVCVFFLRFAVFNSFVISYDYFIYFELITVWMLHNQHKCRTWKIRKTQHNYDC